MPPLITDLDESSDDKSSFASVSLNLSKNEMSDNPQIETCNVTKLKITTPVEGHQPHPKHVNHVKLRSKKQVPPQGLTANQQADAMKKASMEAEQSKAIKKTDNPVPYDVMEHFKKIPSLLTVYDALHMSPKLRASMIYALTHLDKFAINDEIVRAS